ncbi:Di-copper centre-containing protein [Xylariaceae sp. FL0016]|nr:Di-copper centre-containing protein [Xylariaceae sp. FL0016]
MYSTVAITALVLSLASNSVVGSPIEVQRRATCTDETKSIRKAWEDLTSEEKLAYINADLCLMAAPPSAGVPGATSRWDELQYSHAAQSDYIHGVGAFLPFHRYFVTVHEMLIRSECGYTGPLPYWNEPSDVNALNQSVIFDTEFGFGGDGEYPDGCITDGPFVNLTLHFQEDLSTSDYCLSRSMNDRSFSGAAQSNVDTCLAKTTFIDAWNCLEGNPHSAGHGGVAGVMVNTKLSPGDPVFYLHHGYLDKLFWDWQSLDLDTRLTEIGGSNTAGGGGQGGGSPPGGGSGPGGSVTTTSTLDFVDYFNDGGNTTTLNHTLWSAGIIANATIGEVMDIGGDLVCAEFA